MKTIYKPIVAVENDVLRERLRLCKESVKSVLSIIGQPAAGRYLPMQEVETVRNLLTDIIR